MSEHECFSYDIEHKIIGIYRAFWGLYRSLNHKETRSVNSAGFTGFKHQQMSILLFLRSHAVCLIWSFNMKKLSNLSNSFLD